MHGTLAGKTARREGQRIQLRLDGPQHMRMAVAQVVDVVAMEVHVATPGHVFDVQTFGFDHRGQTRGRDRLVQKDGAVTGQQRATLIIEVFALPGCPQRRAVDVALTLRGLMRWKECHTVPLMAKSKI